MPRKRSPRPKALTEADRMMAPLTSLAPLVDRRLASEIAKAPVPIWPRRFSCLWEAGGRTYDLEAETAQLPLRLHDGPYADPRSVTLRVEGSRDRRANDWEGFRIRWSGLALHPVARV